MFLQNWVFQLVLVIGQWKDQHLDIQLPPEAEDQLNIFGSGNVPTKQEKNGTKGFGRDQAILTAAEMEDGSQNTLHPASGPAPIWPKGSARGREPRHSLAHHSTSPPGRLPLVAHPIPRTHHLCLPKNEKY